MGDAVVHCNTCLTNISIFKKYKSFLTQETANPVTLVFIFKNTLQTYIFITPITCINLMP